MKNGRLPSFLIIGSQKAGTTSLYNVLKQHPQVFMPEKKELHLYKRSLREYRRHFAASGHDGLAVGEATPVYICHPRAPALIRKHLPDAKLILTVRNPIDRAYSQYWDQRRHLLEWLTFEEALAVSRTTVYRPGERGYFSRGYYMTYIERYLEHFDPSQLHVVFFEDLAKAPESLFKEVYRFLGIDDAFVCPQMGQRFNGPRIWTNPAYTFLFNHPRYLPALPGRLRRALCFGDRQLYQYPPMKPETRRQLVELFADPNRRLAAFTGRNLDHWNA